MCISTHERQPSDTLLNGLHGGAAVLGWRMQAASAQAERRGDTREAAREYLARGWAVIPLPRRSKNPGRVGWQTERYTLEEVESVFDADGNIGLLLGAPSGGLVDVDLDTAEAVAAAPFFLPPTEVRHGRPSNRGSHYWFRIVDEPTLATIKHVDPARKDGSGKKCTLIELRATGGQTVVPPSIHAETCEPITWEAEGEPAPVTAAALKTAVLKVAAVALIAWRWPDGCRHDAALSLAGLVLRGGMPEHEGERFIEAVARVAGDAEWSDRVRAVRDTAAEIAAGKPATGGPRLAELLQDGTAVVAKLREWLDLRSEIEVDEESPPLDVFGDATLVGSPDLPRDTLPSVVADYAVDEAQRLGVDLAMLAMPCLVVCAAAIDDAFVVQPKAHDTEWTESPRLWLGVVTEPGGRKTPALQKATAPLRAAEQRWLQSDREALAAWKNKHDETEERPRQRRLIVDDATTEALSDILADNPRGVLCVRDELSAWFGSFDAYRDRGGRDRGLWLELYNGGGKPVDRVKRGNIYVPNWSACLLGGIQPGPMRRLASKINDDGLLQRVMVVFPRAVVEGVDRRPNYAALARYSETVVRLVDLERGDRRVVFRLSDAAQAERAVVERLAHNVMLLPETSAAFRAHLSKWPGLFARLVCTYHVTDAAADGAEPTATIGSATASRVARLMTEYLLPHAARFYTELLGQEHLTHARWLAGYILAHQLERITARDVGRVYRELRGEGNRIADVMTTLVLAGWASEIDSVRRPPTRWKINPRVHALFAERAAHERQRREAVRAEIACAAFELGMRGDA